MFLFDFLRIYLCFAFPVMALWPLPRVFEHGNSTMWLSAKVEFMFIQRPSFSDSSKDYSRQYRFGLDHEFGPAETVCWDSTPFSKRILQAAIVRTKDVLFSEQFVPHKFYPRHTPFEPDAVKAGKINIERVEIEENLFGYEDSEKDKTLLEEAYMLKITDIGLLFYAHSKSGRGIYTPYAPATIVDRPAFIHRGLNLDIARNQISPKDVKRTIDAMSFNKLNRLHLHATDSQSWPIEIPALPDLAMKGAYHTRQIWSVRDLTAVQEYGLLRGIEVYVEIDMPGHTASIHHAYPNLITAFDKPWAEFAAEPPAGQLKLKSPDVPPFVSQLLDDLLPRISDYSNHFHIGGDELNTNAYTLEPAINSSSKEVLRPLLQSFYDHVLSHVGAQSLTPIAWEEVLLDWELNLPASIIIQTWRKEDSLASVVARGYRALFGSASHWYLDTGLGTFLDPDPSKTDSTVKPPYHDWNPPYKNWRQVYSYDPLKNIPDEHKHLVIGGEVHLWGELTDSMSLDGMLWPRVAAAAEVLWQGKRKLSETLPRREGDVTENVTRRLAEMRERLVARGYGAGLVQMEWCLQNRGGCLH